MTEYEMKKKVKEYIMDDMHRLEDFSDMEICCKDYYDAERIAHDKIAKLNYKELESFCIAIDTNTVNYIMHGCR